MAKQRSSRVAKSAAAAKKAEAPAVFGAFAPVAPGQPKPWTVLIFMCGDNWLDDDVQADFAEICQVGSSPEMHVVVQCDGPEGARRFLLPEGPSTAPPADEAFAVRTPSDQLVPPRVNTGDPLELRRFLLWGVEQAPSEHVAVILSGLGINPKYVRDNLPAELQSLPLDPLRLEVHRRLFSICHDSTSRDMLDVSQLRGVLRDVTQWLADHEREPTIDLIGADLGASAFIEVVYEFEDLARIFVGSQTTLPDAGWPYDKILHAWQETLRSPAPTTASDASFFATARTLGGQLVRAFREAYPDCRSTQMVALDLDRLETVALALDSLALALLQTLGDWHVLDAIYRALAVTEIIQLKELQEDQRPEAMRDVRADIDFLPAVDLVNLIENLWTKFEEKLAEKDPARQIPEAFGQRQRIEALRDLVKRTLPTMIDSPDATCQPLVYSRQSDPDDPSGDDAHAADRKTHRGLSVVMPPRRRQSEIDAETGHIFNLSQTNYLNLNFSKKVHWAALVGAMQMILEKPHALWRVISSMLTDASGPARDAAMARLMSSESVVADLREQFQSLGDAEAHTLSLERLDAIPGDQDQRRYRLRLEASLSGGTIAQVENLTSQNNLDERMQALQDLIDSSDDAETVQNRLRSLGERLGEDVLQNMATLLKPLHESFEPLSEEAAPHLTLQFPADLMKYPWELMHDQLGMLGEKFALGRQVYMDAAITRSTRRPPSDTVRALVIGDPKFSADFISSAASELKMRVRQLPNARIEAEVVCDEFQRMRDQMAGVLKFQVTARIGDVVTSDDLRDLLRNGDGTGTFDIVHFAGHAYYDPKHPTKSGWLMSNGILRASDIRNTLSWNKSPPWLVYANACEAGMDSGKPANQYQRDVFGLVTAFVNQGVSAYIAPLWPVDDFVAQWLAWRVYRNLLQNRYSLGESLRRAKAEVWSELKALSQTQSLSASQTLSWASLALYGDPTTRVLQSMWSPQSSRDETADRGKDSPAGGRGTAAQESAARTAAARSPAHAPACSPAWQPPARHDDKIRHAFARSCATDIRRQVLLPKGFLELSGETRALSAPSGRPEFELVECGGLRYWRIVDSQGTAAPLPNSPFASLAQKDNVRDRLKQERGLWDYARVVGRWMLEKVTGGGDGESLIAKIVKQYDRDMVPKEQLLSIQVDGGLKPFQADASFDPLAGGGPTDRVLLYVHGTFSKTHVKDLAISPAGSERTEPFLTWAKKHYRAVLGFDHWTLSKSPEENATLLWELLPKSLRSGQRLDIITHSRGGLVARSLVELLGQRSAVRKVIFVGTPNCGTTLANPANWGRMADLLVNLVHTDPSGFLGRLSGFLVHMLAAGALKEVPGLLAQNPNQLGQDDFLGRLQAAGPPRDGASYFAVAANYIPDRDDFNLKALLDELKDQTVDNLFAGPNDLVVDTAHVWAIDSRPDFSQVGPHIPAENILLFNTDSKHSPPAGVRVEPTAGVHHVNLFQFAAVHDFLRDVLEAKTAAAR